MSTEITHGPNIIHPEVPSAVGSRNSINRHSRDEYAEARVIVDEEVDKILNHIHAKLPPEAGFRLDVMPNIKSKLHDYFNQGMQNMSNRYLSTVEDEMGKKIRDLIDVEEVRGLNSYTPRPISYLLDRVGGSDNFNMGEVEKSIVNIFGHLHGHVQREVTDMETHTNSLLRRKTDVGAFVRGENAYAVVKCSFRDNIKKPDAVMDVKLSLNILDSELISPIFPYHEAMTFLIKELMSKRLEDAISKEVDRINDELIDEGKEELLPEEKIFEKIKALDEHTSDDDSEKSVRYSYISKRLLDAIEGLKAEISSEEFDPLSIRENIYQLIEDENIRNRGYNSAVNIITSVLDWSRMGYQHVENYKAARHLIIREYEDTEVNRLPDERFKLELQYCGPGKVRSLRIAYQQQLVEFKRVVDELWSLLDKIYQEKVSGEDILDWDVLSNQLLNKQDSGFSFFSSKNEVEEEPVEERQWNEVTFVAPEARGATESHPTMENEIADLKARFPLMRKKVETIYENTYPDVRDRISERIDFVEAEFVRFNSLINPFHLQPGVLLDVDITSVKRKSTTMMKMANVLNEFLYSISKGFSDTAFASFSRRRSTQRGDIEGQFESKTEMVSLVDAESV